MEELKNIETRAESLARKMNNITNKFKENLDIAEDMDVTGNDIIEFVENKTKELPQSLDDTSYLELINLNTLLQDFDYIRKTLRENCENGKFLELDGVGILSKDPVTNLKYHFVVTAAMITRICWQNGMELERTFRLSDFYIQKLDDANFSHSS